jgi:hypothetical protein
MRHAGLWIASSFSKTYRGAIIMSIFAMPREAANDLGSRYAALSAHRFSSCRRRPQRCRVQSNPKRCAEADSLEEAINSTVTDVKSTGYEVQRVEIEGGAMHA